MEFELVPILAKARELYAMPRGMERFRAYIASMTGDSKDDIQFVPMGGMNPMGREHVAALVDRLIAMDAEGIAAGALRDAQARLREPTGHLRVGLSVLDDLKGGWTHRELSEAALYFETAAQLKRGWITVPLWTGSPPDAARVREETLAMAARACYQLGRSQPRTLRDALVQESAVARSTGRTSALDKAALDAIARTLAPHLDDARFATLFAGMYGDRAANEAGHKPLGIPERGGFELAASQRPLST